MKKIGSIIAGCVGFILIFFLFSHNVYMSSPGFVSQEDYENFMKSKPLCYGYSLLLNEKATWVDAPGKSICIGILRENN